MKVLVVSPSLAKRLSDVLPEEIEVIHPEKGTDDELEALAEDVEVIVSTRLSASVAKAAKNLKLLQKTGAGVDAQVVTFRGRCGRCARRAGRSRP